MSFILYALGFVLLLFVAFIGMQFALVRRMRRIEGQPVPELTGKPRKWIKSGKAALFYFYSPNCSACRTMTPVVEKLKKKKDGVFAIDISQDMDTARRFGVMATPTTIIVHKGVIRQVLIGPQPPKVLEEAVSA